MLFGGQHLPSRHLALPNFTSLHWSASGCPPEASHLTPRQWSFWTTSHLKAGSRNAFRLLKFNGSTNIGEVVTSLLAPVARCFALAESAITGSMSMPKYMQLQIQNFIAHIHAHGWMHGHFLFVEPACQFSPWLMRVHMSAFKRKKSFWPRKSRVSISHGQARRKLGQTRPPGTTFELPSHESCPLDAVFVSKFDNSHGIICSSRSSLKHNPPQTSCE